MPQPHKNPIGVIDIAFMWSFYYLNKETSYSEALKDILLRGGDTDTNAAIVGGLLGAAEGIDGINKDQIKKVLDFDPQLHGGHQRPSFLIPKD
jgi:ADP-ribosyl-[dinitrogen reductase] hydrolase